MTTLINLKQSTSIKSPTFVIASKYNQKQQEETPGPGYYNPSKITKTTVSPLLKKHYLQETHQQPRIGVDLLPPIKFKNQISPAYYSPNRQKNAQQYTIQSKYYGKLQDHQFHPGPQTYYKQTVSTSPQISMKFRQFPNQQESTPGPDLYQSTLNKIEK